MVPRLVAVGIVDGLEVVHVQDQQGQLLPRPQLGQAAGAVAFQGGLVQGPGKGIHGQFLFQLQDAVFLAHDVKQQAHAHHRLAVPAVLEGYVHLEPALFAPFDRQQHLLLLVSGGGVSLGQAVQQGLFLLVIQPLAGLDLVPDVVDLLGQVEHVFPRGAEADHILFDVPPEGDQVALPEQQVVLLAAQAELLLRLLQGAVDVLDPAGLGQLGADAVVAGKVDHQGHHAHDDVVEHRARVVQGGQVGQHDQVPRRDVHHRIDGLHQKEGGKGHHGRHAADLAHREGGAEVERRKQGLPQHKEAAGKLQDAIADLEAQVPAAQGVGAQKDGRRQKQAGIKSKIGPVVGGREAGRRIKDDPYDIEQFYPDCKHRDDLCQRPVAADCLLHKSRTDLGLDVTRHTKSLLCSKTLSVPYYTVRRPVCRE